MQNYVIITILVILIIYIISLPGMLQTQYVSSCFFCGDYLLILLCSACMGQKCGSALICSLGWFSDFVLLNSILG